MLRIYGVILEVLKDLPPVVAAIELHDKDLARQLRRAATSIALNCSEGSGSNGGTRRERYRNALGSARARRALAWMPRWRSGTSRRSIHRCSISSTTCELSW